MEVIYGYFEDGEQAQLNLCELAASIKTLCGAAQWDAPLLSHSAPTSPPSVAAWLPTLACLSRSNGFPP